MNPARMEHAKSLITPFNKLDGHDTARIRRIKSAFAQYEPELLQNLALLNLSQLSDRLAWIPFKLFANMEKIGQGGFSTVYITNILLPESETIVVSGGSKRSHIRRGIQKLRRLRKKFHISESYWSDNALLGRQFALKEVDSNLLQELVLSAHLSNIPGTQAPIMVVFGLSKNDQTDQYLMLMEYAIGGNMEHYAHNSSWNDILETSIKMTENLEKLHKVGIIHRDLHPCNIIFTSVRGTDSKIIDTGLSKAVQQQQEDGAIYGRPGYHPPEIFYGADYTQASDIFCLATLLWQLVTRVPPRETAKKICESREDGLREDLIPGAPDMFNDIIRRCWNRDPAKRPMASEVFDELLSCQLDANRPNRFTEVTKAFVAERRVAHQRELSNPDSFALVSSFNSSRLTTLEELNNFSSDYF